MNKFKFSEKDTIFSIGVFLKPVECIIQGKKQWRWIAIRFEDDSFFDGKVIDVYDYGDNFQSLFSPENTDN